MKYVGLAIVMLGTALAAAFGAQNADPVQSQQEIVGRAGVLSANAADALEAYCALLPEGARSPQQLEDGCASPPQADPSADLARLAEQYAAAASAVGSAHNSTVAAHEVYCDSSVDGALTADQAADGCAPVKAPATAEQAEKARVALEARRQELTVFELAAQELRVRYCELGVGGVQTPEQVADLCRPPRVDATAEAIASAREAWQAAWEPVPGARAVVAEAVAAYCGLEVGGRVIAQQQNEGCAPVKVARTADEVAALRATWKEAMEAERAAKAASRAALDALCGVVVDGSWAEGQAKLCPTLPSSGTAAATATARAAWVELRDEAERAREATKYAASRVAADVRVGGWFARAGVGFLAGLLLILLGAFIARRAVKAELIAEPKAAPGAKPPVDLGVRLAEMSCEIRELGARVAATTAPTHHDLEAIKGVIERIQSDDLEPIVETRAQLVVRYGVGGYAEVFGPLSGGERYLNRSWVSLVDRYWEETARSLESAAAHFDEAKAALDQLAQRAAA